MVTTNKETDKSKLKGVVQSIGGSHFPAEFITTGEDFNAALGKCVLRDDQQKNDINELYGHLKLISLFDIIEEVTSYLNSSPAVGGLNREQALEAYTGILRAFDKIIHPEKKKDKSRLDAKIARGRSGDEENEED